MDPTRGKEIAATFEEIDAAMTMDTSQIPGDGAGGDGGDAGNGTSLLPQPSVTEETSLLAPLPESDFESTVPYFPAPGLLHRRANSDITGLTGKGEVYPFSTFTGAAEVNNSAFVNPSLLMARAAGLLPPRPRPRHQHSQSMDVSSSLQAHRLLGLPETAPSSSLQPQGMFGLPATDPSSSLQPQGIFGLPETTAQSSSSLQALRLLGLPATTTPASSSLQALRGLLGLPATAPSSSHQLPQRLQLGLPATAQASSSLPPQRLPELPATAPSSSRQAQRLQLGSPTTTPSSPRQAERLQLGSPATSAGQSKSATRKAMLDAEFAQMATNDPERARRMLANRQSAARSKERKARYLVELEQKARDMETAVASLSANVALWQRTKDRLTAKKDELLMRVENREKYTQSQNNLTESLQLEIQYLKMNLGGLPQGPQPVGGDQLMHHQMGWMQQLQMPPPNQLPQSSHQPLHPQEAQQQQAQPNLRMKEPMDTSTYGGMDDDGSDSGGS